MTPKMQFPMSLTVPESLYQGQKEGKNHIFTLQEMLAVSSWELSSRVRQEQPSGTGDTGAQTKETNQKS